MFEAQYRVVAEPQFTAAKFAARHNEELEIRVASIEPEFSPILAELRSAGARHKALSLKFVVVRGSGDTAKIAVSQRAYRRADAFTIFLNQRHQLAWLGNVKFWGAEPSSVTSRDFLGALQARVDAFVEGAAKVGFHEEASRG
jgi:hypothetical protein